VDDGEPANAVSVGRVPRDRDSSKGKAGLFLLRGTDVGRVSFAGLIPGSGFVNVRLAIVRRTGVGVGAGVDECPLEIFTYDWPHSEACAVSFCESRWQADAIGGGVNLGLFQLWVGHAWRVGGRVELFLQPGVNVQIAYDLWRENGWSIWACKP
jgi:hypothetical protein